MADLRPISVTQLPNRTVLLEAGEQTLSLTEDEFEQLKSLLVWLPTKRKAAAKGVVNA